MLRILSEATDDADRAAIAQECASRYEANSLGALALAWLRGLFRFDSVRGARVLIRELDSGKDANSADRAIETLAALFGDDRSAVAFEVEDAARRAHLLGQLVRYAYAFVRREDDQVHEGVYTPNTRDHAQTARHFLLSMLLDTPDPMHGVSCWSWRMKTILHTKQTGCGSRLANERRSTPSSQRSIRET